MQDRDIMKLNTHIRIAWILGCVSAGLTFIAGVLGILVPDRVAQFGIDGWNIVDALCVAALAFGVYHESRFCAVALLVYFMTGKIVMAIDAANYHSLVVGLAFIYFFFRGAVATFQLRRCRVNAGLVPAPSPRRKKLYFAAAGIGGALLALFVVFVVLAALGPVNAVVPGEQLKAKYTEEIRDLGLLEKGEVLTFFYSDAFYSIRSGSYFFTDRKVVLYNEDWEKAAIIVPYGAITAIELIDGPEADRRQINIYRRLDTVLAIPLPGKGTDYKTYYELLVRNWKRGR